MKRVALALVLLSAAPAAAQVPMTAHNTYVLLKDAFVSVPVKAANSSRRYLAIINDGSAVAYCTVDGTDATLAGQGIKLAATGTTGDRHIFEAENVPLASVSCISGTANNNILVIEGR